MFFCFFTSIQPQIYLSVSDLFPKNLNLWHALPPTHPPHPIEKVSLASSLTPQPQPQPNLNLNPNLNFNLNLNLN